jgi:hypothetical protein
MWTCNFRKLLLQKLHWIIKKRIKKSTALNVSTHVWKMYLYHCLLDRWISHVVCTGHLHLKTWLSTFLCLGALVKSGEPARSRNMRCIATSHFGCFSPTMARMSCTHWIHKHARVCIGTAVVHLNIYCKFSNKQCVGALVQLFYLTLW